jgi:aryl-alcohol dehydrogenase-like predicted oxidoreductase
MKYRTLGKTGLKVSEIGFGCGNIGGLMVRAPLPTRLAAVRRALELGINYFDTAAAYGNGLSETNLGEVLAILKPQITLATKFALAREELKDIKAAISRSFEASLKRLGRERVDILQLHTPLTLEDESPRQLALKYVLGPGGVVEALEGLRRQGLVRFIGFTALGQTAALHRVIERGRFDLCQVYLNLLNPSAAVKVPADFPAQDFGGLLEKAAKHGVGVAAIRVLAGGALGGDKARQGYAAPAVGGALAGGSDYEMDRQRAIQLAFLEADRGQTLSQAALRFVLGQPAVSTALVGFSDVVQIEEAVASSDLGPLRTSELNKMAEIWRSNFDIAEAGPG